MASKSDPITMGEAISQCRLLKGRYFRTPEMLQPDGSYVVRIELDGMGEEPQEMEFLRRDFGWIRLESGVYGHKVFGPEVHVPLPLDQR